MNLKEKIHYICMELRHDNVTAYRVIKEAGEKIEALQKENERLAQIEKAFLLMR